MSILIDDNIIISLNSANATSLNSYYNSNVVFNTLGILKDDPNIAYSEISIVSCQIPVSFYVVNYSNNVLNYQVSGTNYSITITVGNYNASTFITELTTRFAANGQSFTITFNNISGILTFQFSQNFTFLGTSTCLTLFGFVSTITSSSNSLTMIYPMNLLGQTHLKICSKALSTRNIDVSTGYILMTVPVNVPSYGIIAWENNADYRNILTIRNVNNIDIQIYDQNGTLINFNNANWNITLKLTVHRFAAFSTTSLNDIIFGKEKSLVNNIYYASRISASVRLYSRSRHS